MSNYTPGPYTETGLTAISAQNRIIANVTLAGEFATQNEVKATRRLFCLAPDTLAALIDLADAADVVEQCWEKGDLAGAVQNLLGHAAHAREVIAKAEGRS